MKINEFGYAVFENDKIVNKYKFRYQRFVTDDFIGDFKFSTIRALSEILASGKETFFASDFNLGGGTMNALGNITLGRTHAVTQTGNTKDEMVNLHDDIYIKVKVYEWRIDRKVAWDFIDLYKEAVKFALGE